MHKTTKYLRAAFAGCVGLLLLWVLLALVLPSAKADPPPQDSLYFKSRLGLMPPAYGLQPAEQRSPSLQAQAHSGIFQSFVVYPSGSWPEAVTSGEYTDDGRNDAALSTSSYWDPTNDNRVHLFAQTATGALTRTQRVAAGTNPIAIARGDLNRDGLHDLAAANQDDDTLGMFLQAESGTLTSMVTYTAGVAPDGVAVGDFNGDLRDDVAVSHAVSQTVAIYHQQADGTFAAPVHHSVSSAGYNDITAGDLNGDGYDDLVLLRGAGHTSSQVAIFYQQYRALGAPVFRTAEDGGFLAHGLAVGDVTGDGRDDVVVTAGGNTPQAYLNVFPQQPDGSLAISPTVYSAYHLPEAVEVGDVNHDGRNDVVAVQAAWMSLSVYTQTVTGTLSAYERYSLPYTDFYRPAGLALADVTNDGALDTLIASHGSISTENGLVMLANSGDAPTSTITVPGAGTYITDTELFLIQGTASTAVGTLEISTDGGQTWHAQPLATSWSYTWTVPITDGIYIILSRVTDANGKVQSPPARSRAIVNHTKYVYLPIILKNYLSSGPDLIVTDIRVDPPNPTSGQQVTVYVTVKNQGDQPVAFGNNFYVDFYVDTVPAPYLIGDIEWGVQGADFGLGQSQTCAASFTFSGGAHNLYAQADTDKTVPETDEANNVRAHNRSPSAV